MQNLENLRVSAFVIVFGLFSSESSSIARVLCSQITLDPRYYVAYYHPFWLGNPTGRSSPSTKDSSRFSITRYPLCSSSNSSAYLSYILLCFQKSSFCQPNVRICCSPLKIPGAWLLLLNLITLPIWGCSHSATDLDLECCSFDDGYVSISKIEIYWVWSVKVVLLMAHGLFYWPLTSKQVQ